MLKLITATPKATLNFNTEKKVFEIWQDGRKIGEILTDDKKTALKTFNALFS